LSQLSADVLKAIDKRTAITDKPEPDAPISADRDGPGALPVAFERVEIQSRQCHVSWSGGRVQLG